MTYDKQDHSPSDKVPGICPECRGRGWKDNLCAKPNNDVACMQCNGKGSDFNGHVCSGCKGTGRIDIRSTDKLHCALCSGAGVYPVPDSMTITEFAYRPWEKKTG